MKRPLAERTNEDHIKAARARVKASRTLLKQARTLLHESTGVESMSESTRKAVTQHARDIQLWVTELHHLALLLDKREAEAREHLATQVAARKRRAA